MLTVKDQTNKRHKISSVNNKCVKNKKKWNVDSDLIFSGLTSDSWLKSWSPVFLSGGLCGPPIKKTKTLHLLDNWSNSQNISHKFVKTVLLYCMRWAPKLKKKYQFINVYVLLCRSTVVQTLISQALISCYAVKVIQIKSNKGQFMDFIKKN